MTGARVTRWTVVAAGLSLVALALLLRPIVRDVVAIWLLYTAWLGRLFLRSVPQAFLWALFLLTALVLATRSLGKPNIALPGKLGREEPPLGPVEGELHWVSFAAEGDYGRWRLAQRLAQLAAASLAHDVRIPLDQARELLHKGANLPPEIHRYLKIGQSPLPPQSGPLLRAFWRRPSQKGHAIPPEAERTLRYLEDLLEVRRDG